MAAEETEYHSLNQGNGLSPIERSTKKGTGKKRAKAQSGNGSKLTPFLQGITVGAVLLIPVGVWCWVRVDVPQVAPAAEESRATSSKGSKQAASKRKPVKPRTATAVPPARIHSVTGGEAIQASAPVVDSDPPPVSAPAPAPTAVVPQANVEPMASVDEFQPATTGQKPKKNVWKAIAAPFRAKRGDRITNASDLLPPGQ